MNSRLATSTLLAASALLATSALSAQITVGPPGSGAPFTSINLGILACPSGGTVTVLPGSYAEQVDFQGRAVTLLSQTQFAAIIDVTLLQPGPGNVPIPAVLFVTGERRTSVLDGFTITGGASPQGGGIRCLGTSPTIVRNRILANGAWNGQVWGPGGGVYSTNGSPLLASNEITSNIGTTGGGVYCFTTSSTLTDNTIADNGSLTQGGGVYCQGGRHQIIGNAFSTNFAVRGGGIELNSVLNSVFDDNTLSHNDALQSGGGMAAITTGTAAITISDSVFTSNAAQGSGGGIHCDASSPAITGNTFLGNFADIYGGAIHLVNSSFATVNANGMTANIAWNSGGGIAARDGSDAIVNANTLTSNAANQRGGGIYVADASPSLRGNTLTANGLALTFVEGGQTYTVTPVDYGGAIAAHDTNSQAFPTAISITGNSAVDNFAELEGGGVWLDNCDAVVLDNTLRGNGTTSGGAPFTVTGGGLFAQAGTFVIERNLILRNEASDAGAGAALLGTAIGTTFQNNIVAKNWVHLGAGGGVWLSNAIVTLLNDTIAQNVNHDTVGGVTTYGPGSGVFVASGAGVPIVNCIVRGQAQSSIVDAAPGSAPVVDYCNVGPNQTGNYVAGVVFNFLPGFVNTAADDFHLLPTSPCKDMGWPQGLPGTPPLPPTDFDSQPRLQGVEVDLGADEVG